MTDYTDLIARLREPIISLMLENGRLTDGIIAERLIRERHGAADALEEKDRRIADLSKEADMMHREYKTAAARIAELEATIRKFQLVEKALNYFLEKDTPHTWRYRRNEAEELARAALEKKG